MTTKKQLATQPMVSIICRTVNRPTLAQTITSVGKQDWPSIELVLVDAAGEGLGGLESPAANVQLSVVCSGKALNRPQAANAGLDAARSDYLLFLDDDDWIAPRHISKLMNLLLKHPDKQVVYSKTRKTSVDGKLLDEIIAVPFDRTVLRRDNFIPIHAALFSAALVRAGCRFDESLAVYEDWDFWLQCAEHTDFKLATHIGAYYRMGGDSATMLDEHAQRYQPGHPMADARAKLLHKWRLRWSGQEWNALLGLVDQTPQLKSIHHDLECAQRIVKDRDQQIDALRSHSEHLAVRLAGIQYEHQQLQDNYQQLQDNYQQLQTNHIELSLAHEALDRGVKEILNSFSWRVTAPYRWVARRTVNVFRPPQRVPLDTVTAHTEPSAGPLVGEILTPPSENYACGRHLTVHAWAWSPDPLSKISVFADDQLLCNIDPISRLDNIEDARRIGFAGLVNLEALQPGKHLIRLETTDTENRTISLSRHIIYRDPDITYRQWLGRQGLSHVDTASPDDAHSSNNLVRFNLVVRIGQSDNDKAVLSTLTDIARQSAPHWHCQIWAPDTELQRIQALLKNHVSNQQRFSFIGDINTLALEEDCVYSFPSPGERLRENCLSAVNNAWSTEAGLLYCDHDEISKDNKHRNPWFTFSWSPDLLLSTNYVGGIYFVKGALITSEILTRIAGDESNTAWRYSMLLKLTNSLPPSAVLRLPRMLWSAPEQSTPEKERLLSDELHAVRDTLIHDHQLPEAEVINQHEVRYVRWPLAAQPRVSIIIPTTGNMRFLKPCLDTLASTDYPNLEIVVLDNSRGAHPDGIQYARDVGTTVIACNETFNWSRLNNKGAKQCTGDILLFLNDDIEIVHPDWLAEMVRQAVRDDIGTVGCMLLYPNGAIQHAGVFLVDHGGGARHLFHRQLPGEGVYQHLDQCVREVSASTGACLMIRRDRFEQLGGFDEDLSIVGNDIDLCLRALEAGLRNLWTPHSQLIHHESVSRKSKPIGNDEKSMWKRWEHRFSAGDPYYHPALSLLREDCELAELPTMPVMPEANVSLPAASSDAPTHGVNLIAYIRASMGVGEAARGNAAALQASGIPFGIINYERGNPSRMDNLRWQHREISEPVFDINLLHINADHLPAVVADLGLDKVQHRYNIGFWAWELPEFPDRWLNSFQHLDEIWVPSTFVNQAVATKSPVPVITIPHVVNIDLAGANRYQRSDFGIEPDAFVFITMFDIHSVARRKNPFGAIQAFQKAFSADDKFVQLLIKINNADQANITVLRELIGNYQNILLIDQHLDRARIDSLINCVDCYVSLHHSEGFGLGPAEAMGLGKATILTNWSGNTEYMRHDNCLAVNYRLKQLGRDYGPYEAHQHWAVPDLDHAAEHMRTVANNPGLAKAIGERARLTIASEFSAEAIGARMKRRLESIARIRAQANSAPPVSPK